MVVTGLGGTEEERRQSMLDAQMRWCTRESEYLMKYSTSILTFLLSMLTIVVGPVVVFMLKHLKLSGCDVPAQNILCAPCDKTRSGGFEPKRGAVVLCAGNFFNSKHVENTMVHEMMHMYDQCRFKVDWGNLRHHACSEVRFLLSVERERY